MRPARVPAHLEGLRLMLIAWPISSMSPSLATSRMGHLEVLDRVANISSIL
jgi:hypothetical protein